MPNTAQVLEKDNRVLELFSVHEHFCRVAIDPYALIDHTGKVLKSNGHFAQMTRLKPRQLAKVESLDEVMTFEIEGREFRIADLLKFRSPSYFERVTGRLTADSSELTLVLGVYPFLENGRPVGVFLLIRDITAETNLEGKYRDKATQSITDKLTGLFNRGHFDAVLPELVEKAQATRASGGTAALSLIILDIDFFKRCNDTYGHQAGDYVISELARVLKENFRKDDVICRYGGEEYVIILPDCGESNAVAVAEGVRKTVELHPFEFANVKIPVTISLGVSEVAIGNETGKAALARADEGLYASKKGGRNRFTFQRIAT